MYCIICNCRYNHSTDHSYLQYDCKVCPAYYWISGSVGCCNRRFRFNIFIAPSLSFRSGTRDMRSRIYYCLCGHYCYFFHTFHHDSRKCKDGENGYSRWCFLQESRGHTLMCSCHNLPHCMDMGFHLVIPSRRTRVLLRSRTCDDWLSLYLYEPRSISSHDRTSNPEHVFRFRT